MTYLLPPQAIKEFQQIYQKKFNEVIDLNEAKKKAENFIRLFELITNKHLNKYAVEATNTN